MTGKRHLTYFFLSTIFTFTPLAANASCPNGQAIRLDKKIERQYIIARWEGGEYAPCKYIGKKKPNYLQYKCGSMPILATTPVNSRLLDNVISKEGVIIDTQLFKREISVKDGVYPYYTSGKPLEGVEVTEKQIDPLTQLKRAVFNYRVISSPVLPRNIEQREVMDIYNKYKCLKVSF